MKRIARAPLDPLLAALRWIMVGVLLFDAVITLVGQPSTYWSNPTAVREADRMVRYFLAIGVVPYVVGGLVYILAAFWLAGRLPRKFGYVLTIGLTLVHYFGASTWVVFRFRTGEWGEYGLGFLVAAIAVWLAFRTLNVASAKNQPNETPEEADATSARSCIAERRRSQQTSSNTPLL